jgi:hypothetical protein
MGASTVLFQNDFILTKIFMQYKTNLLQSLGHFLIMQGDYNNKKTLAAHVFNY